MSVQIWLNKVIMQLLNSSGNGTHNGQNKSFPQSDLPSSVIYYYLR